MTLLNSNITNHKVWEYDQVVQNICQPFFQKYGLNYFDYARFYNNNDIVFLCSNRDWAKQFLFDPSYVPPCNFLMPGIHLWNTYIDEHFLMQATERFQHAHGLTLVARHINFVEIMNFAAPLENKNVVSLYLNNRDILIQFGRYFLDKASDLINEMEQSPLHISPKIIFPISFKDVADQKLHFLDPYNKKNNLHFNFALSEIILNGVNLTFREIQCLNSLINGDSAKRLGQVLGISYRTAEKHIDAIKRKLNCKTRLELFSLLKK